MKNTYIFEQNYKLDKDFRYAYSPACFDRVAFKQENNSILNSTGKSLFGYEYISILERVKRRLGVVAQTECSFEKFGAPLIVFSDDIHVNEKGEWIYGKHFEVVAYEDGINIWHIIPCPENKDRPIKPTLLAAKKFHIKDNSLINIKLQILKDSIKAWVNDEFLEVKVDDLPKEEFWVGITACEGINRFYSFTVED